MITAHRSAREAVAKWTVHGYSVLLKITDEGLRTVGAEPAPPEEEEDQSEVAIPRRPAGSITRSAASSPA